MEIESGRSMIFDEHNMKKQLNMYIPASETIFVALYCNILEINKKKTGLYGIDAYTAITQYNFYFVKVFELEKFCLVFPFSEILYSIRKKGILGQITCLLSLKNGETIKFLMARRAGIGSKMFHHIENREKFLQFFDKYGLK